jgi:hypothetical protein
MHAIILGLAMALVAGTAAQARDCSGQGSQTVLSFEDWTVSRPDRSVALIYSLGEDKAVTLLRAHLYFQDAAGAVLADAALTLGGTDVVARRGVERWHCPRQRSSG